MTVTFANAAGTQTNGTALTLSLTLDNPALVLAFGGNDSGRVLSAMAFGGVAMTKLASTAFGESECWVLTAAGAGVGVLSAQLAGAATPFCVVAVGYRDNAGGTMTTGTAVSGTAGAATNVALSFSSTSTDLCVAAFKNNGNTNIAQDAAATLVFSQTAGTSVRMIVAQRTGAASISFSASCASSLSWAFTGVPLRAVAAVTVPLRLGALTGVGY